MKFILHNIIDKTTVKHIVQWLAGLTIVTIIFLAASCSNTPDLTDTVTKELRFIDSLRFRRKDDTATKRLEALRRKYNNKSPLFSSTYYRIKSEQARYDEALMGLYADSAMAVFDTEENRLLYPREYFKSLLSKGLACLINRKYNLGLQYYYKAGAIPNITDCDKAELLSGVGGLYFDQQNYQVAGQTWYASYLKLVNCHEGIVEQAFSTQQGLLDNTGIAYERAGLLDSAAYFYKLDAALIDKYDGKIIDEIIQPSKKVLYDNLGGLYTKMRQFDSAEYYLTQSLGIITKSREANVPPLIKMAELYITIGNTPKATVLLKQSKNLLDSFPQLNPNSQSRWHKLNATFLFSTNKPVEAYKELDEYIRIKDSIEKSNAALLTLNVGHEFNALRQENTLNELRNKDKVNQVYLWAIVVIIILSGIIIVLVYRNLAKSRKNYNDTIAHNQKLQKTLEELESANKNYIRVMRVMAHDLRNPLGGITGIAALVLRDEALSVENRHMIKLVESTGNHSMEMINELLRSGLADENEAIETQKYDLANLLYSTVELLQFKAKEKEQTLLFNSSRQPVMATINHEKIWRVFNNLIVNAIKFTHTGGSITVSISKQGNRCVITVTDNGIGIPDKDKPLIFDMFTAAKKTGTSNEKPFGLGLSISKRIIEKHKGKIWFESAEEKGTTFYIELLVD